ncbi:MAG: hypothetical protein ACYC2H_00475 [Thermoplasmatota archaeon]
MTAPSARLLPFAIACLLAALASMAQAGTPDAPEVSDPSGDVNLQGLDVTGVWFEANASTLLVHIVRAGDTLTPVQCANGQCLGAGAAVRVVFNVLRPDGRPAPTPEGGYNGTYVLVRLGPEDANLSSAVGHYDLENVPQPTGPANLTRDGALLTLAIPLDHPDLAIPTGATPGAYRLNGTYALSYALVCLPDPGQQPPAPAPTLPFACRMHQQPSPDPGAQTVWKAYWDRAPDAGAGQDFVFPSPPPDPSAPAATVTNTVTVTQTQTKTRTTTDTLTETFTSTPFPLHVEAQGVPAGGLALAATALGVGLLVRRRMP